MAGLFNIFFNVHSIIGKALYRLQLGSIEELCKILFASGNAHSLSAAAGGCLDHHRKTYFLCHGKSVFCCVYSLLASGNHRNSGLDHGLSCLGFISHPVDDLCGGADKSNITLAAQLCKTGIFRQEAKARMNGICLHGYSRRQDPLHVQIALSRWSRANTDGFVC